MSAASHIVVVSGSHRVNSQSRRVSDFVRSTLADQFATAASVVDLSEAAIPLWDEGVWRADASWAEVWSPVAARLDEAVGIVLVVPEWGGMAPPALKKFLLLCAHELAHKPALIVSVSSGDGGTYPVAELRAFGFKNNRICYLPDHVILRRVHELLNDAEATVEADVRARSRIVYSLGMLLAYSAALVQVRESVAMDLSQFPYGM